jgi:hypothetical protein
MKTPGVLCGIIASVSLCASGQVFVNSGFEEATVDTSSLFQDWNLAAPGWSHSAGSDTSIVYWGSEHLGISQYYLLMDATSPTYAPGTQLAGNYSLAFSSGHLSAFDFSSPWVNAYLSQTLTVPAGTLSLRMLATGPFEVRVGGVVVPMLSLGGNSYGGDISAFTGSLVEVKIINTASTIHTPTVLDNVVFSPIAIPEPSSMALGIAGVALLMFKRREPSN